MKSSRPEFCVRAHEHFGRIYLLNLSDGRFRAYRSKTVKVRLRTHSRLTRDGVAQPRFAISLC